MNYFTKLIERLGTKPQITTVPPKAAEGSAPTHQDEPVQEPAEETRP